MRIYTYQPDDGRRHCREAMAYQCDNGRLVDTFWGVPNGDSSVRHTLTDTELATAVPLFNTDDYDEIDRHMRDSSRHRVAQATYRRAQGPAMMAWFADAYHTAGAALLVLTVAITIGALIARHKDHQ